MYTRIECDVTPPETGRSRRDDIEVIHISNGYDNIDRNFVFRVGNFKK